MNTKIIELNVGHTASLIPTPIGSQCKSVRLFILSVKVGASSSASFSSTADKFLHVVILLL